MILTTDAIIHALRLSRPTAYLFPGDAARAPALSWHGAAPFMKSRCSCQ